MVADQWNGRTVIQRQAQLVIQSNASLRGWGAACNNVNAEPPRAEFEHKLPGSRAGTENLTSGDISAATTGQIYSSWG